jgi:hypothetical protein
MTRRRIKLGGGAYINLNKSGASTTRKLGGIKLTTGAKRTTITSKISKGLSRTTTIGKTTTTRVNRSRRWY